MISTELLQAYKETGYIVLPCGADGANTRFVLHIGIASLPLKALFRQRSACCAAFITAFNPHSQRTAARQNQASQGRLRDWLDMHGYAYREGVGQHPDALWPGEPGFLVLDLPLGQARELGRTYRQNAIVWCDSDAVAQLVLLA